jgi:Uma2 family endonuclease
MSTVIASHIDPDWLAERQRLGLDRYDEMWEGIWHFVPPPNNFHQKLESWLLVRMWPLAEARGLEVTVETGLFDPAQPTRSWRTPDLVVTRPDQRTHRGAEGGVELVVEIRSPGDETFEKFPFFARHGVAQVLVVLPDNLRVELYRLGEGGYRPVEADDQGFVTIAGLDLSLGTTTGGEGAPGVNGPTLVARWPGGSAEIRP